MKDVAADEHFSRALDSLEAAAAKGRGAAVLDALLVAWRLRRLPELTDAIEALSLRYQDVVPKIEGKTERTRYERLLDRVAAKRSVDVASIAAELASASVIRAKDHMDRLAVMDPDPRIARALLDHVATRRYNLHNKVWTAIFRELRRHGDARIGEALAALPLPPEGSLGANTQTRRIEGALAHLKAPTATDDGARRIAAVHALIPTLALDLPADVPKTAPSGRDEAALFAEMIANPDDDAVRLVLADLYAERGDIRSELVALQIKNARADKPMAKDLKREKQLLKEHLLALLGPLEQVVDRKTCRFERGFLAHAEVKFKTAAQRRELLDHPMLATLTSIATRELSLVRKLPRLHTLSGLSWKGFVELSTAAGKEPLPMLTRVEVDVGVGDPGEHRLTSLEALPALEVASFSLFGLAVAYDASAWEWLLARAVLAGKLEIATDFYRGRVAPALDVLDRHPRFDSLSLRLGSTAAKTDLTLAIERTARGYAVRLAGAAFDYFFVSNVFEGLVRKDVVVSVKPPPRPSVENFRAAADWLLNLLGDRLIIEA